MHAHTHYASVVGRCSASSLAWATPPWPPCTHTHHTSVVGFPLLRFIVGMGYRVAVLVESYKFKFMEAIVYAKVEFAMQFLFTLTIDYTYNKEKKIATILNQVTPMFCVCVCVCVCVCFLGEPVHTRSLVSVHKAWLH